MADLLSLSARIIDDGVLDEPPNRVTQELSELGDGLAVIESFSHVVVLRTDDGLVCFDTSGAHTGRAVVESLRGWTDDRVHSAIYTHGHVDHVGGAGAFVADAERRGHPRPRMVGHENVAARFRRYRDTNGYNRVINARQFGGLRGDLGLAIGGEGDFLPKGTPEPDLSFADTLEIQIGGLDLDLRHARGETDDHLWAWIPSRRIICAGDFFIWNFPNAGNPQKAQRYPVEWAAALRAMKAMDAELFIPAHGLPIQGTERIGLVLDEVASALEFVTRETLARMNAGEPLDAIVRDVRVHESVLEKPYLRPLYDEPEFIVRNVWRLYGGWYDGNPSRLKPAPDAELAAEIAQLVGGVEPLVERAAQLADADQWRLACHLIETAVQAAPDDKRAHSVRADIYQRRRKRESSLMAKGIFGHASRQSEAIAKEGS